MPFVSIKKEGKLKRRAETCRQPQGQQHRGVRAGDVLLRGLWAAGRDQTPRAQARRWRHPSHRGEQGQLRHCFLSGSFPSIFRFIASVPHVAIVFSGFLLEFFRILSGVQTRIRIDLASVVGIRICIRLGLPDPDPLVTEENRVRGRSGLVRIRIGVFLDFTLPCW